MLSDGLFVDLPFLASLSERVADFGVYGIDGGQSVLAQHHIGAGDVFAHLRHGGGADDVGGHKGALVDESQRKGGEREAGGFGDGGIALHRFGSFGLAVALEAFKQGETRAFGLLAVAVFAGKHAESERRVGQQRHIFAQRDFGLSRIPIL